MEAYPEIDKIYEDIQKLNIQGATNVALSTFEGMKLYLSLTRETDKQKVYDEFFEVGSRLSEARPNEPLAKNGVKFVRYFLKQEFHVLPELSTMKPRLDELCSEYLLMISESKKSMVEKSKEYLKNHDKIFTHCHSSTVETLIKELSQGDNNFEVVCTETRPRLQGRITAKNLVNAGIKTTMITDSAADSFIINRGNVTVDMVLIGCDQIVKGGHVINKIGSWSIAMSAHYADKPLYVVTPLLKIDESSYIGNVEIEVREDSEIWPDAPKGLEIYNPAFEIVDNVLITGFVTEFGIVKPADVDTVVKEKYPWVFDR
jgi:ribose 1,5-bisphosphate isomerase